MANKGELMNKYMVNSKLKCSVLACPHIHFMDVITIRSKQYRLNGHISE